MSGSLHAMGVSFVVPVHNGVRWLSQVLASILRQEHRGPLEVLVVDDGSTDGSRAQAEAIGDPRIRLLEGEGRGAAAAINLGVRSASHPILCQVDQDVVLHPLWLSRLLELLEVEPTLAAAQGRYLPERKGSLWARVMGLDLEDRYDQLDSAWVDHVCTGNTAYRTAALRFIEGFDESFGYGYDNDLSYRLGDAGYRLAICREATSTHHWREGLRDYLRQQFGVGYGRLDLVAKHWRRLGGDQISGPGMILHAALVTVGLTLLGLGMALWLLGGAAQLWLLFALAIFLGLTLERARRGWSVYRRHADRASLLFPLAHLLRDLAWSTAIAVWFSRRLLHRSPRASTSMPRVAGSTDRSDPLRAGAELRERSR